MCHLIYSSFNLPKLGIIITIIIMVLLLQMRKLRLGNSSLFAYIHTAVKWQKWEKDSASKPFSSVLVASRLVEFVVMHL